MEKAMKAVLIQKRPCRKVAKEYSIPYVTSRRYCLKYRKEHSDQTDNIKEIFLKRYGYFNNRPVFDSTQELFMEEYLLNGFKVTSSASTCIFTTKTPTKKKILTQTVYPQSTSQCPPAQ